MTDRDLRKADRSLRETVSRREFLKEVLVIEGGVLASISLGSGCQASLSVSTTSPVSGTPIPTLSYPDTRTASYAYIPPTGTPPLLDTTGCSSKVAADRQYSIDHIWVKKIESNIVVMGISEKLQALMEKVYKISLIDKGARILKGDVIGSMEGNKLNVDLISPVSGYIMQTNSDLLQPLAPGDWVEPLFNDPYGRGWLLVSRLDNPEELQDLYTPEYYAFLQTKAPESI
jgi:glycine cleavage system H protein